MAKNYVKPRIYWIYDSMMQRCFNKNCHAYNDYGGRGITVCKKWRESFEEFKKWAFSSGYEETLSIDRINNNGNYSPKNCKWSTAIEQANNKRSNMLVTYNGETMTAKQMSTKFGIGYRSFLSRLRRGWSVDEAIEKPINANYRKE